MNKLISFAGMFTLLIGAYAMDEVFLRMQGVAQRTSDYSTVAWLRPVGLLGFAVAVLALAWVVLLRSERSMAVVTTYAVVGLTLIAAQTYPGFAFIRGAFQSDLLSGILTRVIASTLALAPNSAAFIAAIGLFGLASKAFPRLLPVSLQSGRNVVHEAVNRSG